MEGKGKEREKEWMETMNIDKEKEYEEIRKKERRWMSIGKSKKKMKEGK